MAATATTQAVSFQLEESGAEVVRLRGRLGGQPLTYRDFLAHLLQSAVAREALSTALARVPFSAFAWECRPVREDDLDAPLDMVAVDSPALERAQPDPSPFAAPLRRASGSVARFANLGGDAYLVVPRPLAPEHCYTHLAAFVRAAPSAQQEALWCELARAVAALLDDGVSPLWVSTAGLGVSWLHVRLDRRPKYYRHVPFRRVATAVPGH